MSFDDERILEAVKSTEILRSPKQGLSTFGTTNIYYYLLTQPVYIEPSSQGIKETVIREGRVIAQRPRIVTPYYLSRLEGFSPEARRYLIDMVETHGPDAAGLFYTYKNEPKELNIVTDSLLAVLEKLNAQIDKRGDPLTSIIRGLDELWDVSIMKFIYEVTRGSVSNNLRQMGSRGLLNIDAAGVPGDARLRIEEFFHKVSSGEYDPAELKKELDHWNLFEEYQDRFFNLFRKK